jgi:hypothetical protein
MSFEGSRDHSGDRLSFMGFREVLFIPVNTFQVRCSPTSNGIQHEVNGGELIEFIICYLRERKPEALIPSPLLFPPP